jgi:hypothetical protein
MQSTQRNVEFGYQVSICSGTKENQRKTLIELPAAGPSGYKPISSQQSGIKYASPIISPYLSCSSPPLFLVFFVFQVVSLTIICMCVRFR